MAGRQMHEFDVEDARHKDGDDPGTFKEVVVTVLAALVLAYLVQGFLVKPFRIPSSSMENTLRCGDRVLVNRLSYRFGDPERGDVVVFMPPAATNEQGRTDVEEIAGPDDWRPEREPTDRAPTAADVNYIKRVIGEPGDTVEVRSHQAFVNGKRLKEPYLQPLPASLALTSDSQMQPLKVPKGTYWMMGDNRDNSADSRVFGFVPREFVIGKAFMAYWPPKRIGGLPAKDPGGPAPDGDDPNCIDSIPQTEPLADG